MAAGALAFVREARDAAKSALASLRQEIATTTARLAKLIAEERSFKSELFGSSGRSPARRPGRRRKVRRASSGRPARRKGPPRAEVFFKKLGSSFTLDQVRKVAGRAAGISLAQWSRAKRIRKTADGSYRKL